MTPTDELRRLLDERGVEWTDGGFPTTATEWCANGVVWHGLLRDGTIELVAMLTPEQAVKATLGRNDSYTREDVESAFVSGYSLGLDMFDHSKPDAEKGWNQNERDLDEEMEERGWVRKEATTHRPLTERATKDSEKDSDGRGECRLEEIEKDCDTASEYMLDREFCFDAVYRCSCGCRFGHVAHERPNFCPNCGAKVVSQ